MSKELETLSSPDGAYLWTKGGDALYHQRDYRAIVKIDKITDAYGGTVEIRHTFSKDTLPRVFRFTVHGRQRGDAEPYFPATLRPITPEEKTALHREFRLNRFRRNLDDVKWDKVSDKAIEDVVNILTKNGYTW